ncbi:MAG: SDR family oxidoreductase, partial [Algoriphagus sp.]|nr:SDR family oxidoreductase [Algoriphagus sp.]
MTRKTVLITGGASGIGLAMVNKFASAGCSVFFIDTNHQEGTKVQLAAHEKGFQVKFLEGSITDYSQLEQLIHSIPGKLDVLINNAGISHIGKVENTTEEDFDRVYQVNVKGMFNSI